MFDPITPLPTAPAGIASVADRVRAIPDLLRRADVLVAQALALVARGGIEAATGLSPEMFLMLEGRQTHSFSSALLNAAGVLEHMPRLRAAFSEGRVSWAQVRSIVCAVSSLTVAERAEVDGLIGPRVGSTSEAHPDELVRLVDDEVSRRRQEHLLKA